ncbi:MAG: hypothetical protein ACPGO5_03885 [Patescibacteria group bacterium]
MYLLNVLQNKKVLSLLVTCAFVFGILFVSGDVAYGQESFFEGLKATGDAAGLGQDADTVNLPLFIGNLIKSIFGFIGVLFLLLMFYGGFTWMTAAGNEESVGKAKRIISQAAIGLFIAVMAFAISDFIFDAILQAQSSSTTATE